ncbi:MAG: response regulator [Proteobacteria bacterium]|nr:response regulator [Pseudomonadota bacterium]MBU1709952.1 response regulator [Pseudomonadota bacterium]
MKPQEIEHPSNWKSVLKSFWPAPEDIEDSEVLTESYTKQPRTDTGMSGNSREKMLQANDTVIKEDAFAKKETDTAGGVSRLSINYNATGGFSAGAIKEHLDAVNEIFQDEDKKHLKRVLIVDDEEDMIWSLQKNLNNETLEVEILTASSGEEALEILQTVPINLIVTDIRMSGISGIELLIEVRNKYPDTGVVVMTAYPTPESKTEAIIKGSLYFLEKPFDINDMRKIVRHALKEDSLFRGTVAGVELTDIIQINRLSRTTTALRVKARNKEGIIFFQEGNVVHAICGDITGEDAFYEILSFKGGVLESVKVSQSPAVTIRSPVEALLIEGTRRIDEEAAAEYVDQIQQIDQMDEIPEVSIKISDAQHESGEDVGSLANSEVEGNQQAEHLPLNEREEKEMEGVKNILTEFTNIPGVNTACLVGRDGFLLDSIAIAGVDTEMIGAIASSGFGASEAMGNQLEKGALSMTMVEYENGPVMFSPIGKEAFLVIVADKSSNLGMIRLKIKKHAKDIELTAAI